jgi:hypothetical protein
VRHSVNSTRRYFVPIRHFLHACKIGLEGIVSKRLGSRYRRAGRRTGSSSRIERHPAVKREAEEDWGR